ncbi:alpha/beta-hydrolase [Massarina eburnea CBS 473.64]|uniref:Alpha/beta-hydrolase n=1 Tax=Massarina eburnea CBS 473.64 TaxID=1395130 RepID=A0A6A6SGY8_9PLEO|nr:alpha/beta-hydrolase [Massarina eburnea CBS 473.64]
MSTENPKTDPTTLTQTFSSQSPTHSYTVKRRSLRHPSSPPLIFIHGTPWSSRVWVPHALALSRQYHVYVSDNTSFSDSPIEQELPDTEFKPANKVISLDADLARQTEVFTALFKSWEKEWDDGKPHIFAHDDAGLDNEFTKLAWIFEELPPHMAVEGIVERYIRKVGFYELSRDDLQGLEELWLRDVRVGKKGSTEVVEGRYEEVGEVMPVKLIWGAEDRWIAVRDAVRLGEALGAREVVVVEDAGYLIMYDQPTQLGVELGRWLTIL